MPLTGRNNLAETPLLQYLGDQRWRQVSRILEVPTRDIVDENGERLYATFFYVEVAFPPDRPMDAFGENDRFTVVSTLTRFGASMLDGVSFLIPSDRRGPAGASRSSAPYASIADANAQGVPAVRLSNIFVRKFGGAEWLKKGRPAHERFDSVPALAEPPDSYAMAKDAEETGRFAPPPSGWLALTEGPVEREYRLVPDRDLNGVGLVYFANYPMFLDICERDVLSSARVPVADSLIDRRALVRRQSAYLNNASSRDTLRIEIEPWCHVTEATGRATDRRVDLHLYVNARMSRRSDGRQMMVATSHKIARSVPAADVPREALGRP
jgi:probable biosynthetic protein (TIGR04098 family)